jgi:hypothetical protein
MEALAAFGYRRAMNRRRLCCLLALATALAVLGDGIAPSLRGNAMPGMTGRARAFEGGALYAPAIRGITVGPIESSQQPGRGYGTAYSAELLDELVRLGANAISITPFGRIWSLRSTRVALDFELPYEENRRAVGRMIAQAKARGLRVLLIPHLWVETDGWRGEIDPGSPEGWAAYQASYREFVLAWARDAQAHGADAFSIGVECKSFSGRFGAYWTELIAEVRSVFGGALTYSANWDEVEDVLFWDQLDWIGVNAFYPLAEAGGASTATYVASAEQALARLGAFAALVDRPVVLVEIGYTTRSDAAVEPWLWPDTMNGVVVDEHEQARALAALAEAAARRSDVLGFFVWRYYANLDDVSQEAVWGFSPHAKQAERVLERVFGRRWAADPDLHPWSALPSAPRDPWAARRVP